MHRSARARRFTAWLALVAMLGFALLPTVSRAMAFGLGGNWTEVCTPQGMRWVSVDADRSGDSMPAPAAPDACALCSLASEGAAPLPPAMPALVLPLHRADPPALFLQAAVTLHAWRSAQPRGPPALG